MKKLLSILGVVAIVGSASASTVACNSQTTNSNAKKDDQARLEQEIKYLDFNAQLLEKQKVITLNTDDYQALKADTIENNLVDLLGLKDAKVFHHKFYVRIIDAEKVTNFPHVISDQKQNIRKINLGQINFQLFNSKWESINNNKTYHVQVAINNAQKATALSQQLLTAINDKKLDLNFNSNSVSFNALSNYLNPLLDQLKTKLAAKIDEVGVLPSDVKDIIKGWISHLNQILNLPVDFLKPILVLAGTSIVKALHLEAMDGNTNVLQIPSLVNHDVNLDAIFPNINELVASVQQGITQGIGAVVGKLAPLLSKIGIQIPDIKQLSESVNSWIKSTLHMEVHWASEFNNGGVLNIIKALLPDLLNLKAFVINNQELMVNDPALAVTKFLTLDKNTYSVKNVVPGQCAVQGIEKVNDNGLAKTNLDNLLLDMFGQTTIDNHDLITGWTYQNDYFGAPVAKIKLANTDFINQLLAKYAKFLKLDGIINQLNLDQTIVYSDVARLIQTANNFLPLRLLLTLGGNTLGEIINSNVHQFFKVNDITETFGLFNSKLHVLQVSNKGIWTALVRAYLLNQHIDTTGYNLELRSGTMHVQVLKTLPGQKQSQWVDLNVAQLTSGSLLPSDADGVRFVGDNINLDLTSQANSKSVFASYHFNLVVTI